MTDPYLIAHKVRGEPAFDVAIQMECPVCMGTGRQDDADFASDAPGCHECDQLGYWWIIPTSGHRAYPWWNQPLDGLGQYSDIGFWTVPIIDEMPDGLPDHYITTSAPNEPKVSLLDRLNLKPKPSDPTTPFPRRI